MTDKTEHYDQREALHALGDTRPRFVRPAHGGYVGYAPADEPLGDPPRQGGTVESRQDRYNRQATERAKAREHEAQLRAERAVEPMMVQCSTCGHAWPCAYLPQPLETAAALMIAARCPKGCDAKVTLANVPGA